MSDCLIQKSGDGIDLDVITASPNDVLAGKVIVNKDGEPITGTKPDRGAWTTSVGMNGSAAIPEGSHNGAGKVTGPSVTQRGAWNTRIGVNGRAVIPEGYHNGSGYVDQAINNFVGTPKPINNVRLANGRFEVAVDEGYYSCYWAGNSYEYMSYDQVRNAIGLSADKIKKGVQIMNIIGTFEGYIPTSTDLYLRGNNIKLWKNYAYNSFRLASFDSGQITFPYVGIGTYFKIQSGVVVNLAGFNSLNIECDFYNYSGANIAEIRLQRGNIDSDLVLYRFPAGSHISYITLDIRGVQINDYISLKMNDISAGVAGAIYRIWLS